MFQCHPGVNPTTHLPTRGTTVSNGALEFVSKPDDMTNLQLGDTVEQECRVNQEGAVIKWFKDETELPAGKPH